MTSGTTSKWRRPARPDVVGESLYAATFSVRTGAGAEGPGGQGGVSYEGGAGLFCLFNDMPGCNDLGIFIFIIVIRRPAYLFGARGSPRARAGSAAEDL